MIVGCGVDLFVSRMVMSLQVTQSAVKFQSSQGTVSFSRSTLLFIVSYTLFIIGDFAVK